MTQSNVIPLNPASRSRSSLPPILHTVRQSARKRLVALLEELFNNIDDALFEMADRSRNDIDQHLYFESMRELRLKRGEITQTFVQALNDGFTDAFSAEGQSEKEDFENISIVDNDDLEISVAIAGIVSKVTSQHSLPIMQLTKRLDFLARDNEITERRNPLGPEVLSQAFVSGLACAELDIKIRIILLKLYERFVMERLADLYAEANRLLAEAGVLTDLKRVAQEKRQSQTRRRTSEAEPAPDRQAEQPRAQPSPASPAGAHPTGGRNFQLIQRLLAATRTDAVPDGAGQATNPVLPHQPGSHPGSTVALTTTALLTLLSEAQQGLNAPIDVESVPALLDLRQLVVSRSPEARLDQPEEDVVNFVGMLFDYILNDRNLAIPMKALIGRLQLPIVKLAIMDRSFFERSNHPARLLLNELSSAGIGWSNARELRRDALYDKVEAIVLGVVDGFRDDPSIFEALLADLRAFTSSDQQKSEFVEQRVKDSEQGRARTISAKQTVQKLINQKASGMRLPPEIGRFISETWSRVLVYSSVKSGSRSEKWHQHTETLDGLLWSLQPLDKLADIDRREAQVPGLLQSLRNGMADIQTPEAECDRHIETIEAHLTKINRNDRAYLEEDDPLPKDEDLEEMAEVVLTRADERLDEEIDVEDIDPAVLAQVDKLHEGGWIELRQGDEPVQRCKLATIIEAGARYIFVNRRGMKVAERSKRGLAADLQRGRMEILDESQVFDRALQAVIGNLRQLKGSPA